MVCAMSIREQRRENAEILAQCLEYVSQELDARSQVKNALALATAMGSFAQSAFVDEDDGSALFLGFFLISGQRACFQRRILSSARSSARPTGRWQLHPNCRRIRQACVG